MLEKKSRGVLSLLNQVWIYSLKLKQELGASGPGLDVAKHLFFPLFFWGENYFRAPNCILNAS